MQAFNLFLCWHYIITPQPSYFWSWEYLIEIIPETIYFIYEHNYWVSEWTVADPELFLRGGPADWSKGARSSHASMIPYIINQIFPMKGGPGPPSPPSLLDSPMVNNVSCVLNSETKYRGWYFTAVISLF